MQDTSVMGSIGQAMGKAAHGAALGRAIGGLKDEVKEAIELANGWVAYAKGLEHKIRELENTVDLFILDREKKAKEIATLKEELRAMTEKQASTQKQRELNLESSEANANYGKQIKMRLRQMEKALQHSSADKAALRSVLKPYEELVERLNLQGELPEELRQKAEAIWEKFMGGESLTEDDDVQKIIDEASVPKRPAGASFV